MARLDDVFEKARRMHRPLRVGSDEKRSAFVVVRKKELKRSPHICVRHVKRAARVIT